MKNLQKGFAIPIIIASIALLVVGGGYFLNKVNRIKNIESIIYQPLPSIQTQINNNVRRVNETSDIISVSSCEKIKKTFNFFGADETETDRNFCYHNLAVQNNDVSFCNKIPGSGKQTCIYSVSVKMQNLSMCDLLEIGRSNNNRYQCYSAIASIKQDYEICNKVPDDEILGEGNRKGCISNIITSKGECDKLIGLTRDYCYKDQSVGARVSARDGRCDVLKATITKDLCEKYSENKISVSEVCNKIVDIGIRESCNNYDLNLIRVNYSNSTGQ
jgi:hypothetical protein